MPQPTSADLAGHGAILLAGATAPASPGGGPPPSLPLSDEGGEPLVRRLALAVVEAGFWPVVVVVGSGDCAIRAALAGLPVASAACASAVEEPGGALRRGLARVAECAPQARGVLVVACSTPAPSADDLRRLAHAATPGHPVAAAERGGRLGLPLVVLKDLFDELRAGEDPASVADRDPGRVARVPFGPGGAPPSPRPAGRGPG